MLILKLLLIVKFRFLLIVVLLSREIGVVDVFVSLRLLNVLFLLMVCVVVLLNIIFFVLVVRLELKMFLEMFRIFFLLLRVFVIRFNVEETFIVFWVLVRVRVILLGFVIERELRESGDEWLIVKSWVDDLLNVVVFVLVI